MDIRIPLAFLLAAGAAFPAAALPRDDFAQGAACGGVGADARAALAKRNADANLVLEFFVAGRGNYVADVDVTLTRLEGAEAQGEPLHLTRGGPICYLTVAPGSYRVNASLHGARRSARTTVPAHSAAPARVALGFPETAVDGDLDTRASPGEKQQERTP